MLCQRQGSQVCQSSLVCFRVEVGDWVKHRYADSKRAKMPILLLICFIIFCSQISWYHARQTWETQCKFSWVHSSLLLSRTCLTTGIKNKGSLSAEVLFSKTKATVSANKEYDTKCYSLSLQLQPDHRSYRLDNGLPASYSQHRLKVIKGQSLAFTAFNLSNEST